MRAATIRAALLVAPLLAGAWTIFHIELADSFPEADQVLAEAPQEVWLQFSVTPDAARSSFSVQGPAGVVALDSIRWDAEKEPTVLRAKVRGEMGPGDYTVSWTAAPIDDHAVRGRFGFIIGK